MSQKIRVLGIAPYTAMKEQMQKIAQEFSDTIELLALDGDLQEGVSVARNNFHSDFDVIISRGGTAELLRKQVSLPVIEIGLSEYDILRSIHLAEGISDRIAVVGFPSITHAVETAALFAKNRPDIFTIESADLVDDTMREVHLRGFKVVLCDVTGLAAAKRNGLNSVFLTSGQTSIRKAFRDAILFAGNTRRLQAENAFLREIIMEQTGSTVVFDTGDNPVFSSIQMDNPNELINVLKREIPSIPEQGPGVRIQKTLNGNLFKVKGKRVYSGNEMCTVFYITKVKLPLQSSQAGIHYYTEAEARRVFYNSFFVSVNDTLGTTADFARVAKTNRPVMILGADGTGKESAANLIYMNSPLNVHPFIVINVNLLTEESWNFLIENENSPLSDSDNTLYIIGSARKEDEEKMRRFLSAMVEMDLAKRNRILLSFQAVNDNLQAPIIRRFQNVLGCTTLVLPTLAAMKEHIPTLVHLYLSQVSSGGESEVIDMADEGIRLMQDFPWEHNYSQFKRIMQDLIETAALPIISEAEVRAALAREDLVPATRQGVNGAEVFDMNRTLDKMNQEIVRRVLADCDGNQTLAAKRLGISRTTMWRYVNK